MAASWLFSLEEFESSPSRKDGVDAAMEKRYRKEGAIFIRDLAKNLQLYEICVTTYGSRQPTTRATGSVFYQRFFMLHSFKQFSRWVSCIVVWLICRILPRHVCTLQAKSKSSPRKSKISFLCSIN